jgi:integrase
MRAQRAVIAAFAGFLAPDDLMTADGQALQAFLDARRAAGKHANTLRKERTMIRSFFASAWRNGRVSAETLMSIQSVPPPAGSTPLAQPSSYTRAEIRGLWTTIDERWPKLPPEQAARWLRRFQDGSSPYSRVRTHAIHLQLEAMIMLALASGMRRGEIYRCRVDDLHHDNAYIVARKNDGTTREIPYTSACRDAIAAWLDFRARVRPSHGRAWLNLWGRNTLREPMTRDTFERVLPTYVGNGWTFRRLRDTCAVEWVRVGLPLWHLQPVMGHKSNVSRRHASD